MNGYFLIQIVLYIFAAILAAIAIFNKSDKNKKITLYDKLIMVCIILTLGFSILLEAIRSNKEMQDSLAREKENRNYTDSLTKIIQRTEAILGKSDSTLNSQSQIQQRTDSILIATGNISTETQSVLQNTNNVINNQTEDLANYARDKNPLFPLIIETTIKLPFTHDIFSGVIDSFLSIKKFLESGTMLNNPDFKVSWVGNRESVYSLSCRNYSKYFQKSNNKYYQFLIRRVIHFWLEKKLPSSTEQLSKVDNIFAGSISESPLKTIIESSLELDFVYKTAYFRFVSDGLALNNPRIQKAIGINDLVNNYIILYPEGLCDYEVHDVRLRMGKSPVSMSRHTFSESEKIRFSSKSKCHFYAHKIAPVEIMHFTQFSNE